MEACDIIEVEELCDDDCADKDICVVNELKVFHVALGFKEEAIPRLNPTDLHESKTLSSLTYDDEGITDPIIHDKVLMLACLHEITMDSSLHIEVVCQGKADKPGLAMYVSNKVYQEFYDVYEARGGATEIAMGVARNEDLHAEFIHLSWIDSGLFYAFFR
ncbi:hypothetical protein GOP47_0023595 [Adiantum capillus-veneris]|uniref:Uncharacterized protein n=1 Tax=Adiantum capillus-veneris TaxID=13818 RepID=A0A9D4Z4P3_ADICA|nr:hypothetical protein GOP47_0023595 [Adiantum capillus-veneris]